MPNRRYTEEQFHAAIGDPAVRTMADLCRSLGLVPRGANYESLRSYGATLDVDVDGVLADRRFERRSYADQDLLAALADGDVNSYRDLCRALGLKPHRLTHQRLRRQAAALGVSIPVDWSRPGPRSADGSARPARHTEQQLRDAVAAASSLAQVIRSLGGTPSGAWYRRLNRQLAVYDIDTSHFRRYGNGGGRTSEPLASLLVRGRAVPTDRLRRRLIAEGVKSHRCEDCGRAEWNGQPIPLELDHVDGDRYNNLLQNLRLLCPNCHALTPTYRGRNIDRRWG